jgi:hypothetical protein
MVKGLRTSIIVIVDGTITDTDATSCHTADQVHPPGRQCGGDAVSFGGENGKTPPLRTELCLSHSGRSILKCWSATMFNR